MRRILMIAASVLLIAVGAYGLVAGGFTWTEEERVLDVGPIEATAEVQREREIPPILAGLLLAAGVGLGVFVVTREA